MRSWDHWMGHFFVLCSSVFVSVCVSAKIHFSFACRRRSSITRCGGRSFGLGDIWDYTSVFELNRVWFFWVSLTGCSLIFLSLSPSNVSQTAPGWSSLRSCCCSRLLSISSCHLASSALPAARILCWRAPLPTAPPQGMRGRTCGGKDSQSPPARLPTWVSDGFCWPLRRERDKMEHSRL